MNGLQVFENGEFGRVRVVELDGEPWFVGKDVAGKLGYAETANMRKLLDEDDYQEIDPQGLDFTGFVQNGRVELEPNRNIRRMLIINEGGLYQAIFGSTLPAAKRFKHWVTHEVIPSIRKIGYYGSRLSKLEVLAASAAALVEQEKKLQELQNRQEEQERELQEIKAGSFAGGLPSWREDTTDMINRIAQKMGGGGFIHEVRKETYTRLETREKVLLCSRLLRIKKRMKESGASKSALKKLNNLDVIGQDRKLITAYTDIVQSMAVKHGVIRASE